MKRMCAYSSDKARFGGFFLFSETLENDRACCNEVSVIEISLAVDGRQQRHQTESTSTTEGYRKLILDSERRHTNSHTPTPMYGSPLLAMELAHNSYTCVYVSVYARAGWVSTLRNDGYNGKTAAVVAAAAAAAAVMETRCNRQCW